jgi:transposase
MLLLNEDALSEVTKVLVDGAYTGERFASLMWQILGARMEVVKRDELHHFAVLPQRWVVARSFVWWRNGNDSGRTASANWGRADRSWCSQSWRCYYGDIE